MTLDPGKIPSSKDMKFNEFTEGLFVRPKIAPARGNTMLEEAKKRGDILKKMQGCSKCKARMENPHADYHLTAVIDADKI